MMKFLLGLLLGFVVGVTASAPAQAATFGLHVGSVHLPARDYFNGNVGAYVRSDSGWELGYYKNSIRRDSFYVAKQFDVGPFQIAVGAVSGYQTQCRTERHTETREVTLSTGRKATVTVGWNDKTCEGQSRGYFMPFIAPSYAFEPVLGATPRLTVVPGKSVVLHLGIERGF